MSTEEHQGFSDSEFAEFVERLIVHLKDPVKRKLIRQILEEAEKDYINISESSSDDTEPYDFFKSAGMLSHWDFDGRKLRAEAWRRKN